MSRKQVFPTEEEWHNKRPFQIGASEIATIVGVSKYGSIVDLWNKKVNKIVENIENEAMLWGHIFEDGVARMFEEKTGYEVIKSSIGDWQFVNEDEPWMSCSPDRTYWLSKDKRNAKDWSQKGLLECKTTVVDPEKEENKWMLMSWYCQVQWQLLVAEMEEAHLCCCVFGFERKTIIKHWKADKEFQQKMLKIVREFWYENVLKNVAPQPKSKQDIDILFPREVKGKEVTASDEINKAYVDLKLVKDNIKFLESKEAELKDKLILAIGDGEVLVNADGDKLATYKATKASSEFDAKAFQTANPELYAQFCHEVACSRRFLLK